MPDNHKRVSVEQPGDDPLAVCAPMTSSLEADEDYLSAAAAFSSTVGANAATAVAIAANNKPSAATSAGNPVATSDEQNYTSVSFFYCFDIFLFS